ncbi:MAG: hypothetical protein AB4426_26500 [Xenococcaceae cyanobacterium]
MERTLKATVVRIETWALRNDLRFQLLHLDVSYLSVLQFQSLLKSNRPMQPRKRRKRGLPVDQILEMQIWAGTTSDSLRQIDAELSLSHPLDSPASLSVGEEECLGIHEGWIVEFRIVTAKIGG